MIKIRNQHHPDKIRVALIIQKKHNQIIHQVNVLKIDIIHDLDQDQGAVRDLQVIAIVILHLRLLQEKSNKIVLDLTLLQNEIKNSGTNSNIL